MKKKGKQKSTKKLVSKALKNKPKWTASNGFKYLEDIEDGNLVVTQTGTRAVLIKKTPSSASVIVTYTKGEDDSYYLGNHLWALKTEVKEIK